MSNSNTGITLTDVRNEANMAIQQLKSGDLDPKTAKKIREYLKVIISTAKTQVDYLNAIPQHIKKDITKEHILAVAGTLRDRDAELDESLHQIEENNKSYNPSGK